MVACFPRFHAKFRLSLGFPLSGSGEGLFSPRYNLPGWPGVTYQNKRPWNNWLLEISCPNMYLGLHLYKSFPGWWLDCLCPPGICFFFYFERSMLIFSSTLFSVQPKRSDLFPRRLFRSNIMRCFVQDVCWGWWLSKGGCGDVWT